VNEVLSTTISVLAVFYDLMAFQEKLGGFEWDNNATELIPYSD